MTKSEFIRARRWQMPYPPQKILVMRFQALGDTVITLPYLQCLRHELPQAKIHLLTRREVDEIPRSITLFDRVISVGGGRNAKIQFLLCLLILPALWWHRYDVVLDLQNHRISRIIRKLLRVKAWSEFDRTSPISAGDRTRQTIEAAGLGAKMALDTNFRYNAEPAKDLLIDHGWDGASQLIVLNPAGNFSSRNWDVKNYAEAAHLWMEQVEPRSQFVLMLLKPHLDKAAFIEKQLGAHCINLSGKTTPFLAFAVMKFVQLCISEDSGLMHMSWVQGVPTLALFGSTRKDWSGPQGAYSWCLDASDLVCGPCMLADCKFGDNRCLTRYSAQFVIERAHELIKSQGSI